MHIEFKQCTPPFNMLKLQASSYIYLIAISIAIGLFSFINSAILFSLSAILCVGLLIYLTADEECKKFLIVFFIIGVGLRLVISVFLDVLVKLYPSLITILGDSVLITLRAQDAASYLATGRTDNLFVGTGFLFDTRDGYGYTDYIYFQAAIFYLFGYSKLSMTFLNSLFGTISAILMFHVARKIFDMKIAKATLLFCMFFPTIFFWSITNMKEPAFIFLTAVYILALVKLLDKFKLRYGLVLIIVLLLQGGIRYELIYVAFTSVLIAYFAACRVSIVKKGLVVIMIALLIVITPAGRRAIQSNPKKYFNIFTYHIGHVNTRGTTYKILEEKYYRDANSLPQMSYREFGATFARAWFHFLAEPLLTRLETKLQVAAGLPLSIIWYSLLPFFIIGFFQGLFRYKSRGIWAIAIYFLIFSSAIAITGGNVGTLIRQRDMVAPFFLFFAAAAIVNILSLPLPRAKEKRLQHAHI